MEIFFTLFETVLYSVRLINPKEKNKKGNKFQIWLHEGKNIEKINYIVITKKRITKNIYC